MTSTKQIFDRMTTDKDNFIASIGGIVLTINGVEQPPQFPELDGWQAVEGVPGLLIRPYVVPGHGNSDFLHSRGPAGTSMENGEVPQSCRFTVSDGAVLWRQQWAHAGEWTRLDPGMTAYLQPHERHSYTFLEDSFCSVVITPPFAHHTPRIP